MTAMAARPAFFVLLLLTGGRLSLGARVQVGKIQLASLSPDELAEALSAGADAALAGAGDAADGKGLPGGEAGGVGQAVQGGGGGAEAPPAPPASLQSLLSNALDLLTPKGDGGAAEQVAAAAEKACAAVVDALLQRDVPAKLVQALEALPLENQKRATFLVEALMRPSDEGQCGDSWREVAQHVEDYVLGKPLMLQKLLGNFNKKALADWSSILLRRYALNPKLAKAARNADAVSRLIAVATQQKNSEVALEAFNSLRDFLLGPRDDGDADVVLSADRVNALRMESAAWVQEHLDAFFTQFHTLLKQREDSSDIQSEALRLLGLLLMAPQYKNAMWEYVKNVEYLETMINLLKNKGPGVQQAALHILKLFAANPRKPLQVLQILFKKRGEIIEKLRSFSNPQKSDATFQQDLSTVLEEVEKLDQPMEGGAEVAAPAE